MIVLEDTMSKKKDLENGIVEDPKNEGGEDINAKLLEVINGLSGKLESFEEKFKKMEQEKADAAAAAEAKKLEELKNKAKGKDDPEDKGKGGATGGGQLNIEELMKLVSSTVSQTLDAKFENIEKQKLAGSLTEDETKQIEAMGLDPKKLGANELKGFLTLLRKDEVEDDETKSFFTKKNNSTKGKIDTSVSARSAKILKMINGGK